MQYNPHKGYWQIGNLELFLKNHKFGKKPCGCFSVLLCTWIASDVNSHGHKKLIVSILLNNLQ